jgi:mRNA interferase MazF
VIRRGDIHWVDLDPAHGSEASKRRPAVIVSNDAANVTTTRLGRGTITVVPVTSNVERVYPFHVGLSAAATGLDRDSKAQAEQVRTIDVERLGAKIGAVPAALLVRLDSALRLHLGL